MKQQIIFSLTTVWPRDVGDAGPPELMRQDIGIEAPSLREAMQIARQKYPGRDISLQRRR